MSQYIRLSPGDAGVEFKQNSTSSSDYTFSTAAGRYLALCFLGSSKDPHSAAAIAAVKTHSELFNDTQASFFGVSMDMSDIQGGLQPSLPGCRYFWDTDGTIAKKYGALPVDFVPTTGRVDIRRRWVVLDPSFRIAAVIPFAPDQSDIAQVISLIETLSDKEPSVRDNACVPILTLPRVLDQQLCDRLIAYSEGHETFDSGFMIERDGTTQRKLNHQFKIRRDCAIEDEDLRMVLRNRIIRAIVPQIAKAYQFQVTRIERYLVGRYTGEDKGFFNAHRDNTTFGTAHRRFAVTIALNNDYEGGELCFPEFGQRGFRIEAGSAAVFSCSLLHLVKPVTSGKRYVFVPFLYDEAAAAIREANRDKVKLD